MASHPDGRSSSRTHQVADLIRRAASTSIIFPRRSSLFRWSVGSGTDWRIGSAAGGSFSNPPISGYLHTAHCVMEAQETAWLIPFLDDPADPRGPLPTSFLDAGKTHYVDSQNQLWPLTVTRRSNALPRSLPLFVQIHTRVGRCHLLCSAADGVERCRLGSVPLNRRRKNSGRLANLDGNVPNMCEGNSLADGRKQVGFDSFTDRIQSEGSR